MKNRKRIYIKKYKNKIREMIRCPCCNKQDKQWNYQDLKKGRRGFQDGSSGVEYHCIQAFYSLS
jgi:hypothetical protein